MPLDPDRFAVLLGVGVLAGVVGVVVSLGSLLSYPALLALGLPPVAANVTNTVALTFTGLGAVLGSRRELVGTGGTVLRLAATVAVGAAAGAALLLLAPAASFEQVAPVLVIGACLLLLAQPRLQAQTGFHPRGMTPLSLSALGSVAVYTGYFGAAAGVLTLAALGWILDLALVRLNAVKNALAGVANGVAALAFMAFGPVDWSAVLPLALGFLTGGYLGPRVARRLPARTLRMAVVGCGLSVGAVLAARTY